MFSAGLEKTVTLVHRDILYDQVYRSRKHGEQVYKGTDMFSTGHEKTVTLVKLLNRDILYDQVYRSRKHGEQVYKGTDKFSTGHEKTVTLVNNLIEIFYMIRSTDPEDTENKYTRVLTCSLLAMRKLLH